MIPFEKIPQKINNIDLSEELRHRLSQGLESSLIKNIIIDDRYLIDAKLTASYNQEKDEVSIDYNTKEKNIEIPEKLFGRKLSQSQQELLEKGEIIGPIKRHGENLYVGIDKELNKLSIKLDKEIGVPNELSGYKLNDLDKNLLANNKQTPPRLFKTDKGLYFSAVMEKTKDGKGMNFHNVTEYGKESSFEAGELENLKITFNQMDEKRAEKLLFDYHMEKDIETPFKEKEKTTNVKEKGRDLKKVKGIRGIEIEDQGGGKQKLTITSDKGKEEFITTPKVGKTLRGITAGKSNFDLDLKISDKNTIKSFLVKTPEIAKSRSKPLKSISKSMAKEEELEV